jgi:hypothetical protein
MTNVPVDDNDPPLEVHWGPDPFALTRVAPTWELLQALESAVGALRPFALRLKACGATTYEIEQVVGILLEAKPEKPELMRAHRDWMITAGLMEPSLRLAETVLCLMAGTLSRREWAAAARRTDHEAKAPGMRVTMADMLAAAGSPRH